jgi:WD40 repeat protein
MRRTFLLAALAVPLVVGPPAACGANELQGTLLAAPTAFESMAIDPTGFWLVTGHNDGSAELWDLRAPKPFAKSSFALRGHAAPVGQLAVSPNGRWLATASPDGELRVWDLSSKDPAGTSGLLHAAAITPARKGNSGWTLAISGNSRWLVSKTAAQPGKTTIWDLEAQDPKAARIVLETSASVEFCASRRWLVSTDPQSETTKIWDLNADDPWGRSLTVQRPRGAAADALSPDGRWLFARHRDLTERTKDHYLLWDLKEASPAARILITHAWPAPPRAGEVSPDGKWLAIAFDVKPYGVDLWALRDDDPAARRLVLQGHENTVRNIAFSPNSRWLVSAGDDITIRAWDLRAGNPAGACRVLPAYAAKMSIAPNSRWLATTNQTTVRLWDLEARDRPAKGLVLRGPEERFWSLLFTPDSRWLLAHGADKTVCYWAIGPGQASPGPSSDR